jgi:hypothetical protein
METADDQNWSAIGNVLFYIDAWYCWLVWQVCPKLAAIDDLNFSSINFNSENADFTINKSNCNISQLFMIINTNTVNLFCKFDFLPFFQF